MNLRRHPLLKAALLACVTAFAPACQAMAESAIHATLDTLFEPLLADPTYPHIAVMGKLDKKEVQLDIGAPVDLYQDRDRNFAVGVDFGTWSLLRRNDDFKFPVDAIDYLFGVNATWKRKLDDFVLPFNTMSTKLRISHISAHFEDGHYDEATNAWLHPEEAPQGKIPFTYSREFINLTTALSAPGGKVYLGYQYMFHTIPGDINPHSIQAGAEVGLPANSYLAADFKLLPVWDNVKQKTDAFRGTWNLQAGMRLTSIGLDQVRVAANYFTGISRQGMYLNKAETYTSLGMIIDL
ncbi:MAG: DUF1207 domain-containing protein [Chlorobiaceae bacterium]|nr:DUF1207 domain-containing protein [Chlorobiaceae bacterium]